MPHNIFSKEQQTVTAGGGEYVGIQDGVVYFNDPQTKTTLTVRLDVLTSDAVRNRILESRKEFETQESGVRSQESE